jgi:hypothetical protein
MVPPGDVVLRRRGVDGDVVVVGEALGDDPAVRLRTARNVGPEAVDDARELHR